VNAREIMEIQVAIARELAVRPMFDAETEIERRVDFLGEAVRSSGLRGVVLGISGGVDSCTAGRLCQLAVEQLRSEGVDATFVAMRLPHDVQNDEADAQRSLDFIAADRVVRVDIAPATAAMAESVEQGAGAVSGIVRANIKARQRMIAQYAVAAEERMLVVGTDHAAEAVTGYFTKHGDGACDLVPLTGLTKRRVRALARMLGAPPEIVVKTPTADLDDARPGRPDEDELGLTYEQLDDFLEGHTVDPAVARRIIERYQATAHKRALPLAP